MAQVRGQVGRWSQARVAPGSEVTEPRASGCLLAHPWPLLADPRRCQWALQGSLQIGTEPGETVWPEGRVRPMKPCGLALARHWGVN